MWFMLILWKTFRGMWRLVIGLIIGVVLYVITFTTPSLEWIFNDVYAFSNAIVSWVSEQSWYPKYEKWDHLVKPGDRLPLILYVLVGRFIWLMFEAILFTFPYWLFIGRNKQKKTANSPELARKAPEQGAIAPDTTTATSGMAPVMGHSGVKGHGGVDSTALRQVAAPAAAIAASAMASKEQIGELMSSNQDSQPDSSENLES